MNLNRLVARVLHAIADELEPASEESPKPAPAPEPVGNDAPLEVAAWRPADVEHHGLGFRDRGR